MKRLFAVGLGLAVVGLAGPGRADDKDDNAKKIVGKWEVAKAGGDLPAGSTVEFTKDGKITAVVKADGQELKIEGTYKVEKDKLTVKLKLGDQEIDETATIKKLTDDALHLEDKDKKVDEFKKVK
ncbi:MAG: TIGR03066 family protein [Gemmataceae bacterium]|nr:TIGR03066 family protein [Gemmataceae bacterium]